MRRLAAALDSVQRSRDFLIAMSMRKRERFAPAGQPPDIHAFRFSRPGGAADIAKGTCVAQRLAPLPGREKVPRDCPVAALVPRLPPAILWLPLRGNGYVARASMLRRKLRTHFLPRYRKRRQADRTPKRCGAEM